HRHNIMVGVSFYRQVGTAPWPPERAERIYAYQDRASEQVLVPKAHAIFIVFTRLRQLKQHNTLLPMAKSSIYRSFMKALCQHCRSAYPFIRPLTESRGRMMPKASTFYAGVARPSGLHVFLNFQHSAYAWQVGRFTINVVLAEDERNPTYRWL